MAEMNIAPVSDIIAKAPLKEEGRFRARFMPISKMVGVLDQQLDHMASDPHEACGNVLHF